MEKISKREDNVEVVLVVVVVIVVVAYRKNHMMAPHYDATPDPN